MAQEEIRVEVAAVTKLEGVNPKCKEINSQRGSYAVRLTLHRYLMAFINMNSHLKVIAANLGQVIM